MFICPQRIKNTLALAQNIQQIAARSLDSIWVMAVLKQHLFAGFYDFGELFQG